MISSSTNGWKTRGKAGIAAAIMALCAGCGGGNGGNGVPQPPPRVAGITVVAGDATASGSADGVGSTARFDGPRGIAVDADGNLYVADERNGTIRKITADGKVSTLAGVAGMNGQVDSIVGEARLASPTGLTIDATGNLYVTDAFEVRKVSPSGLVTTLATIDLGSNIDSRSTRLFLPGAVAVDAGGNLYVTNGIGTRRIAPAGLSMIEGVATMDNVFGTRSFIPRGITIDASGTVYVADLQGTIAKLGVDGKLATIAGTPGVSGAADGTGAAASFSAVYAMAVDTNGNLYAADYANHLIRKVNQAGVVTTLAGTRGSLTLQPGPLPGSLAGVSGIAVDKKGIVYATSGNAVIKITPAP